MRQPMQGPRRVPPTPARASPVPLRTMRREPEPSRGSAARAAGVFAVFLGAAALVLHGLTLATAPAAAARTLGAVLPALTDLDQALAAHAGSIAATAGEGGAMVPLPGLPLRVEVPAEAATAGGEQLRDGARDAMVRAVYAEGHAVFRVPDAPPEGALALFGSQWAVRRSLNVLTRDAHDRFVIARAVAGVAAGLMLLVLALQVEPGRRPLAVGSALVGAGLLALLATLVARALVWLFTSGDNSVAGRVVARVGHDLWTTVVITALIATGAGAALAALGALAIRLTGGGEMAEVPRARSRRRERRAGLLPEPWEET